MTSIDIERYGDKDLAFISQLCRQKTKDQSNGCALFANDGFSTKNRKIHFRYLTLNRGLLQQCANTLSREQSLVPEVCSYFVVSDRYISDFSVTIYLFYLGSILHEFPHLHQHKVSRISNMR